jgi:phospholipase/carboxylesterase
VPLKVYTIDGRGEPDRLLFLVHGYGANEFHLAAYGPLVDPGARFLVAAPRGPIDLPPDGAAWWRIDPETFEFDLAELPGSLATLDEAIDRLCAQRGFDRARSVIGGFSQGAALSLALAFRRGASTRPAGVLCLSGFLHEPSEIDWDVAAGAGVPVFVAHGRNDPFLGLERAERVVGSLRNAGVEVEYHDYPMGHDICLEELVDLRAWLAAR